jgi:hypothetical protein
MKKCAITREFTAKTGIKPETITTGTLIEVEKDTDTINFFPAKKLGDNFSKYISQPITYLSPSDILSAVKQYTNHVTWYCSQVNLILAADSPEVSKHSEYIRKLQWSIKFLSLYFPVKEIRTYRGLTCSKKEIDYYQVGTVLHIPSFLSTSRNIYKLYTSDKQNTVMIINLAKIPSTAFSVNSEYSDFAESEEEALFTCYSRFKVLISDTNRSFNNKNYEYYIELELQEDFEGLAFNNNVKLLN